MQTPDTVSTGVTDAGESATPQATPQPVDTCRPVRIDPDLKFIHELRLRKIQPPGGTCWLTFNFIPANARLE